MKAWAVASAGGIAALTGVLINHISVGETSTDRLIAYIGGILIVYLLHRCIL